MTKHVSYTIRCAPKEQAARTSSQFTGSSGNFLFVLGPWYPVDEVTYVSPVHLFPHANNIIRALNPRHQQPRIIA